MQTVKTPISFANCSLCQMLVYSDPLIQNNLPIFISQLRALYPNKENEDKYTELVRGYLDFDVEMENVGVFWSGTEVSNSVSCVLVLMVIFIRHFCWSIHWSSRS
jgi:hypothetical protein